MQLTACLRILPYGLSIRPCHAFDHVLNVLTQLLLLHIPHHQCPIMPLHQPLSALTWSYSLSQVCLQVFLHIVWTFVCTFCLLGWVNFYDRTFRISFFVYKSCLRISGYSFAANNSSMCEIWDFVLCTFDCNLKFIISSAAVDAFENSSNVVVNLF